MSKYAWGPGEVIVQPPYNPNEVFETLIDMDCSYVLMGFSYSLHTLGQRLVVKARDKNGNSWIGKDGVWDLLN